MYKVDNFDSETKSEYYDKIAEIDTDNNSIYSVIELENNTFDNQLRMDKRKGVYAEKTYKDEKKDEKKDNEKIIYDIINSYSKVNLIQLPISGSDLIKLKKQWKCEDVIENKHLKPTFWKRLSNTFKKQIK